MHYVIQMILINTCYTNEVTLLISSPRKYFHRMVKKKYLPPTPPLGFAHAYLHMLIIFVSSTIFVFDGKYSIMYVFI